jgi:hypothetical protein
MVKSDVAPDRRLEALRRLKYLLDEAFRLPGTNLRIGWDAIIGLVPYAGDLVAAALAGAAVVQAHRMGVPRIVQLRMLLNIGIDVLLGVVPVVGDAADVFWKASTRNFDLLERHAGAPAPRTRGDWLFVVGVMAAIALLAIVPLLLLAWLLGAVLHRGLL